MAKFTIATAKKALALAYPDIEFTYGEAGRGRQRAHAVSWTGGPNAMDVRHAAGNPYQGRFVPYHFIRQDTPEERAVKHAQWDAEHAARVAAEPARRAAAKASGIEKRKATSELKKATIAKLAAAFAGVDFDLSGGQVAWTDGPEAADVAAALGERHVMDWRYRRALSPEFIATAAARKAAKVHTDRLARRLAASKVRALQVAKGIERRRYAYALRLPRSRSEDTRQLVLPFGDAIAAFNVQVMGGISFGASGRV